MREAAAFAVADADGRERIWAAVALRAPTDDAKPRQAMSQVLGDKTPDRIEIVETLPRTGTGTLKRGELRQRFSSGRR